MMAQFWEYFRMGMDHVLNWHAYDHVVFIIVLLAAFSFSSWKRVLKLIGIIVLCHTLAMFLSAYQVVSLASKWLELLFVITLLVTIIFNLRTAKKKEGQRSAGVVFFLAAFFGLIKGMEFSGFSTKFGFGENSIILPLLEFSLGIGAAYLIIGFILLVFSYIFQNFFRVNRRDWIIVISAIVIGIILPILREIIQKFL